MRSSSLRWVIFLLETTVAVWRLEVTKVSCLGFGQELERVSRVLCTPAPCCRGSQPHLPFTTDICVTNNTTPYFHPILSAYRIRSHSWSPEVTFKGETSLEQWVSVLQSPPGQYMQTPRCGVQPWTHHLFMQWFSYIIVQKLRKFWLKCRQRENG